MFQRFLILSLVLVIAMPLSQARAAGSASAPKLLGTYGGWKAYSYDDKNQPVCYMTLAPKKMPDNKKFKRGQSYLTITHRPSESSKDVVSYVAGYNFKSPSNVSVIAGKKDFNLFTQKDTAWSRDSATDHALAGAIRDNASLKFTGSPDAKGATTVTDTVSTNGAGDAYRAISKACGYAVEAPKTPKKTAKKKH